MYISNALKLYQDTLLPFYIHQVFISNLVQMFLNTLSKN